MTPFQEKCICNHANPEDCFPKTRCACKVHGKPRFSFQEKTLKEFDEKFENDFADYSNSELYLVFDYIEEYIKSFLLSALTSQEALARKEGYDEGFAAGSAKEAMGCHKHCEAQAAITRKEVVEEMLTKISSMTKRDYLWEIIAQRSYMSQSRSGPIAQARRDGFDIGKTFLVDILNSILIEKTSTHLESMK